MLSTQLLQEYSNVALRKLQLPATLVVQAAIASGCKRVLSQDLHHGGVYSGVRVENPFRATAG